ncbi:sphingosine N-acyltransferase lac1 [Arthroderma uncinatum]|uniref:sphingosine N-acyltransferase lac1 n=1 Tax=Arthroderma uncinatum TaxID=74035 RepID=UPI00144A94B3|nr:sphingosine N-acyltransferase lac1 [Arthroderma uncinatum]KAF3481511.1 sphingosine N-acyltransferase lac1 [Arthroderma uncinatum]
MAASSPPSLFHIPTSRLPSVTTGHGITRRRRASSARSQEVTSNGSSNGHVLQTIDEQRRYKRKNTPSVLHRCKQIASRHTWTVPLAPMLAILFLYAINPTESNVFHHFIFLSYKEQQPSDSTKPPQYGKGLWDIAFVSFYTIVLSVAREFIMQELLRPLASFCGLKALGKKLRFMEQTYTAIYFGIIGPAGLYVMSQTPVWYFNTRGMYEFSPHKTHEAAFKFYYLFQAAYWAQQAIVMLLGMEKRRKDFRELVTHHIVTLVLIALSYRFHFTYVGIAVYITHDISDFFLATSKSLNYIDSPLVGLFVSATIGMWIYLRNYLNLRIIFSLFNEFDNIGPTELNWAEGQFKCIYSKMIFLVLLVALQSLNLFWLFLLLRIAYRFVVHNVAKDERSDEESEAEEPKLEETKVFEAPAALAGNEFVNGSTNGVTRATDDRATEPSTSRKTAS